MGDIGNVLGLIGFIGTAVAGAFTLYFNFKKNKSGVEIGLIDLLDKQVKALERQVSSLEEKNLELGTNINDQNIKISELQAKAHKFYEDNQRITNLLTEKDSNSKDYREKGLRAMALAEQTQRAITRVEALAHKSVESIDKLYVLMEKHLSNEAQMINKM